MAKSSGSGGRGGGTGSAKKPWEMGFSEWRRTFGPGGPRESEITQLRQRLSREALMPRERR